MKIIYLFIISSLLVSCSASEKLKEQQHNHFQPTETTYLETVGSTSLSGMVTEKESKDPVIYGSVALYQNDVLITAVETDFDGKYIFPDLEAGIYDLEVSYIGFPTKKIAGIKVESGHLNTINVKLEEGITLTNYTEIGYEVPLYQQDGFNSGRTFTSAEIKKIPITRN